MSKPVILNLG